MKQRDQDEGDSPLDGIGEIPEPIQQEGTDTWLIMGVVFFVLLLSIGIGAVVYSQLRRGGLLGDLAKQIGVQASPESYSSQTPSAPAPPAPPITTNVSGPTSGTFEVGTVDHELTAGVARYRRALINESRAGGLTAQKPPQEVTRIELALYKSKPSEEERAALLALPGFLNDAKQIVGTAPTVLVQLDFPKKLSKCDARSISSAKIAYLGDANSFGLRDLIAADLDMRAMLIRGEFAIDCRFDDAGELILNTKTTSFRSKSGTLGWNLEARELMEEVKLRISTELKNVADAVAVYSESKGDLTIGLFSEATASQDWSRFRSAGKIVATPTTLVISKFEIPSNATSVNYDNVAKGYTLEFLRNPAQGIEFVGSDPALTVTFEPGMRPLRLDGKLKEGERLIGRYEGGIEQTAPEGNYILTWSVPFNALVLIVP